jgi:hypothetical protein
MTQTDENRSLTRMNSVCFMSGKLLFVCVTVDMDGGYNTMTIGRKRSYDCEKRKTNFHGKKTLGSVLIMHNTKHRNLFHGNSLFVYYKLPITWWVMFKLFLS